MSLLETTFPRGNLQALQVTLSEAELRRIDAISPPGSHTVPFYDAEFGPNRSWL